MNNEMTHESAAMREVLPGEYWPMASEYLRNGRRDEVWHINRIECDGQMLRASARLEGYAPSKTDNNKAHLSIFSAREMDAQFAVIGIHLALGLKQKTAEVWLLRGEEECARAITDLDDVRFEMRFSTRKTSSGKTLIDRVCEIADTSGGLIRLKTTEMLSQPLEK